MAIRNLLLAVALALTCSGGARAGEDYYVLMFGSQRTPSNPEYSHSFAAFVRASWPGEGPCPQDPALEVQVISWLPIDMKVDVYKIRPECGHNVELHRTIQWCLGSDMRVSLWGAYRTCPELYYRAVRVGSRLESGQVRYLAADLLRNSDRVTNCIHALANVVDTVRLRIGTPGWGEPASFAILKRYEPYIPHPGCTHPWVGTALGLDQYPIIYRDYRWPLSGAFGGPIFRMLGSEDDMQPTFGPPLN